MSNETITVTCTNGPLRSVVIPGLPVGTTVGEITSDPNLKARLGLPEAFTVAINGVEACPSTPLRGDVTLAFRAAAGIKQ